MIRVAIATLIILSVPAHAKNVSVRPYVTKNGTYVAPSNKSAPNPTKIDNYSAKGNVNPYTGKEGTRPVVP